MPPTQLPLLDEMPELEIGGLEDALRRVAANANPDWSALAYQCAVEIAATHEEFTSDDIDLKMMSLDLENPPVTPDKRAMGAVMRRICREGLAYGTDRLRNSCRRKLHYSGRRVWRSLTFFPLESRCSM